MIDEKFFCKTFLRLFFATLIFSSAYVAQAQQGAEEVWKQIPKTHNRQALYYYRTGVRLYQKAEDERSSGAIGRGGQTRSEVCRVLFQTGRLLS